jgi:predicted membrane protein
MAPRYLIYIIIVWIAANALFPLFLNSVERLYQKQIDRTVAGTIRATKSFLLFLLRVFLIVLMLPTIVLVIIFERTFPKVFRIRYLAEIQYSVALLFKRDLWNVLTQDFRRHWRGEEHKNGD